MIRQNLFLRNELTETIFFKWYKRYIGKLWGGLLKPGSATRGENEWKSRRDKLSCLLSEPGISLPGLSRGPLVVIFFISSTSRGMKFENVAVLINVTDHLMDQMGFFWYVHPYARAKLNYRWVPTCPAALYEILGINDFWTHLVGLITNAPACVCQSLRFFPKSQS